MLVESQPVCTKSNQVSLFYPTKVYPQVTTILSDCILRGSLYPTKVYPQVNPPIQKPLKPCSKLSQHDRRVIVHLTSNFFQENRGYSHFGIYNFYTVSSNNSFQVSFNSFKVLIKID